MSASERRLSLQFGTFTCAVVGFDDPFAVQLKALEAIRKLAKLSPDFGAATRSTDLAYIKHVMMRHLDDLNVTANVTDTGIEFCRSATPAQTADAPKPDAPEPTSARNGATTPLLLTPAQAAPAAAKPTDQKAPPDADDQASDAADETEVQGEAEPPQAPKADDELVAKRADEVASVTDEAEAEAEEPATEVEDAGVADEISAAEDDAEVAEDVAEDTPAPQEEHALAEAAGGEMQGLMGRKFATSEKSARLSRLSGFFEGQKNVYDFNRQGGMTPSAPTKDDPDVEAAEEFSADAAEAEETAQDAAAPSAPEPAIEDHADDAALVTASGPKRPLRIIRNEPLNTDLSGDDSDDDDLPDPVKAEAEPTTEPIDDEPAETEAPEPIAAADAEELSDEPVLEELAAADTASDEEPAPEPEPEPEPVIEFVDDGELNLRNFAHRTGAETLPEILEVSAAYAMLVDEQSQFSRRHLQDMANQITRSDQFSAEDHIRSFGKLLRSGAIRRVGDGNFIVSTPVRNKYLQRMEDW